MTPLRRPPAPLPPARAVAPRRPAERAEHTAGTTDTTSTTVNTSTTGTAGHRSDRPGSAGEHRLQADLGSTGRADRFYREQVLDHLNPRMRDFVGRQTLMFVATSDAHGHCDNTLRAGPPGFLRVLDPVTVAWPEFRGNGVLASVGNIAENAHVGLLLVDFVDDVVGLHVNGRARLVAPDSTRARGLAAAGPAGKVVETWVEVTVEEAYIHCSKHIPRLGRLGDDEVAALGPPRTTDFFGAAAGAADRATAAAEHVIDLRERDEEDHVIELRLQRDALTCR